jgi:hypothetical protein
MASQDTAAKASATAAASAASRRRFVCYGDTDPSVIAAFASAQTLLEDDTGGARQTVGQKVVTVLLSEGPDRRCRYARLAGGAPERILVRLDSDREATTVAPAPLSAPAGNKVRPTRDPDPAARGGGATHPIAAFEMTVANGSVIHCTIKPAATSPKTAE